MDRGWARGRVGGACTDVEFNQHARLRVGQSICGLEGLSGNPMHLVSEVRVVEVYFLATVFIASGLYTERFQNYA
jgi:hypothetical protein